MEDFIGVISVGPCGAEVDDIFRLSKRDPPVLSKKLDAFDFVQAKSSHSADDDIMSAAGAQHLRDFGDDGGVDCA